MRFKHNYILINLSFATSRTHELRAFKITPSYYTASDALYTLLVVIKLKVWPSFFNDTIRKIDYALLILSRANI